MCCLTLLTHPLRDGQPSTKPLIALLIHFKLENSISSHGK